MKKKIIFITIIATSLAFGSCEKEEEMNIKNENLTSKNHKKDSKDVYYKTNLNVGQAHNELLSYYFNNIDTLYDLTNISLNEYNEVLDYFYDELVSLNYTTQDGKEDLLNNLSDLYEDLIVLESNGEHNILFGSTLNEGGFLHDLYPNLSDSLIGISDSTLTLDSIINRVDSWENAFTEDELIAYNYCNSIISYSANYWQTNGVGNNDPSDDKSRCNCSPFRNCDTWVVVNDAIGGLFGAAFGGVGAIIVGGIFSAGTSEDIANC